MRLDDARLLEIKFKPTTLQKAYKKINFCNNAFGRKHLMHIGSSEYAKSY